MLISKVRKDGVFDGIVEVSDQTTKIPPGHSFSLPPEIPDGFYAVMRGGWKLVQGAKPEYPPRPSESEILQNLYISITENTQNRLDNFAETREYSSMLSATTYVASTVEKFRIEGQYCVEARDLTWAKLYEIFEEVQSGKRTIPNSYEDIEPELPVLQWPT
jgi:hypothetical protein